jgi:hypothetical protein
MSFTRRIALKHSPVSKTCLELSFKKIEDKYDIKYNLLTNNYHKVNKVNEDEKNNSTDKFIYLRYHMVANSIGAGWVDISKYLFSGSLFTPDYKYIMTAYTRSYGGTSHTFIDPISKEILPQYDLALPSHRIIARDLHKELSKNCKNFPKLEEAQEICRAPIFGMFGCPAIN